jgi:X-Tfes, XVIPCD
MNAPQNARNTDTPREPLSFASQVRGLHAQAIDVTLAHINADVYNAHGQSVDGWSPLTDEQLKNASISPALLVDERAGFRARIYSDQQGHYVLAFCGTNEGKDWLHNVRQGLGLRDKQYELATTLAQKASEAFGDELAITGHSLGGGLAAAGSIATGTPAVTFNAAGLHDNTIERLGLDPDAVRSELEQGEQIRRYAVDHEILTTLQERNLLTRGLLPDSIGHKIQLPDPDPQSFWQRLVPGSSLKHGVDIHGMDAVLKAQQLAQPSLTNPAHPGHAMFNQALQGLHGIDADKLGFRAETEYENAAGALAVRARSAGLSKIDHVVPDTSGTTLFAVEGRLDDAAHRTVHVDKVQAAALPLEASAAQLQQAPSQASQQAEREQRRTTVLSP